LNLIEFASRDAGDADLSRVGHQASAPYVAPSRASSYRAEMLATALPATGIGRLNRLALSDIILRHVPGYTRLEPESACMRSIMNTAAKNRTGNPEIETGGDVGTAQSYG